MKYYIKQPAIFFIVLPFLASLISCAIAIPILEGASDDELSIAAKLCTLLLFFLFYFVWLVYANRQKDYVELLPGTITWGYDPRRNKPNETLQVKDIQVFEIVTMNDPPEEYYLFINGQEPRRISGYQVPIADMVRFCSENEIIPVRVLRKYLDMEELKLRQKHIFIKYHKKGLYLREVKIRYSDIATVEFVVPRPISNTENYYVVHTKSGVKHEFAYYLIERPLLEKYAREYEFLIVEKRLYT